MGLARHTRRTVVVHAAAAVAHQRYQPPQEQIDLRELCQPLHRPAAEQPVIGVVIHALRAQTGHQPVKELRRGALEQRIRFAAGAHAIHHIAAGFVFGQHGVHGMDVVLSVTVQADRHIRLRHRLKEPGQQGILVPPVAGKPHPAHRRLCLRHGADGLPGAVAAAVVHKQHTAVRRNAPGRH